MHRINHHLTSILPCIVSILTKFKGKETFNALVLMIQISISEAPFSFVCGSQNNWFVLCCSHHRLHAQHQQNKTHALLDGNFTSEGIEVSAKRRNLPTGDIASIGSMAQTMPPSLLCTSHFSSLWQNLLWIVIYLGKMSTSVLWFFYFMHHDSKSYKCS
jgi:hypothetical protein